MSKRLSVCGFLLVLLLAVPSVAQVSQIEEPSPDSPLSLTAYFSDLVENLLKAVLDGSTTSPVEPPEALQAPPGDNETSSSFTEEDDSSTESGGNIEPWG